MKAAWHCALLSHKSPKFCQEPSIAKMSAWEKIGSGLRPQIGRKSLKNGLSPRRKNRGKMAQKRESWLKNSSQMGSRALIFLLSCSVHFVRRRFWAISTIPEKSPESSADKMNRACESKDQTLKKIRTLHFPNCLTF